MPGGALPTKAFPQRVMSELPDGLYASGRSTTTGISRSVLLWYSS